MQNLSVKYKIYALVMAGGISLLILGMFSLYSVNSVKSWLDDIGTNRSPSLVGLYQIQVGATDIRRLEWKFLGGYSTAKNPLDEIDALREGRKQALGVIDKGWKLYEPLPQSEEEAQTWKQFVSDYNAWKSIDDKIPRLLEKLGQTSDPQAIKGINSEISGVLDEENSDYDHALEGLNKVIDLNRGYADAAVKQGEDASAHARVAVLIVIVLSFLAFFVMGVFILRSLMAQLGAEPVLMQQATRRLAEGDLTTEISLLPNDRNSVMATVASMQSALRLLISELNRMSREHDAGEIDVKIDESQFKNDFASMAKGVNGMVFGHIAVKKKAMACIKEFGEGNFDAPLETFPGKKAFINDNIEALRANTKSFIADMAHMSQQHDLGDIDVKIDEGRFKGDFGVMARGVNGMVFGHIAVKKKAMACIKEFG
ncbi:MAG: hypothetical protein HKM02_04735, partial [Pseudomonadales bacterium]|nr:hypothetical protein [Pseudomonadales bacterium]